MPHTYTQSLQYGFTYIKNNSGNYKPLINAFIKTDSVTWTPIKTGWLKINDTTWERIYPTPRGNFLSNQTSLSFNTYQHYQSPSIQTLQITNVGDWPLVINSATISDSTGNYITSVFNTSLPETIQPSNTINIPMNVFGNTVGSFSGNIAFTNYIGPLGYSNTSIPVSVTVKPDYFAIGVSPTSYLVTYYLLDSLPSTTVTINNTGNGGNLIINSITSTAGYVTISGLSTPHTITGSVTTVGFNTTPNVTSATFTATAANLSAGTYSDTIVVNSNAGSISIPINVTVIRPHGVQSFTTPGTYAFTVPDHVHSLNIFTIGAGGGGGTAVANGQEYVYGGYVLQGGSGGGGGSGAQDIRQNIPVTPGETLAITVGAGGAGGTTVNSQFYPVSLNYSWSSFMNSYAVWTNVDGVTPVNSYVTSRRLFAAPYSSNYNVLISADNGVSVYIDGNLIGSSSDYTSTSTYTTSMSQGNHVITFVAINTGGPAGFAVVIEDTGNNVLWSTRTDLTAWSGGLGGNTTITGSFGTITVAGGGAGAGAVDDGYVYSDGGDGGGGGGDGCD